MTQEFRTMSSELSIVVDAHTISTADYNTFFGTSGSTDPLIAFCDKERLISSEQYSCYGRWHGWKHEIINCPREYFKRKLRGK